MATVQQIYDYLRDRYIGLPSQQRELSRAVSQLQKRRHIDVASLSPEGSTSRASVFEERGGVVVTKNDHLYWLYSRELEQEPHRFERRLGNLECVVYTNTTFDAAQVIVIFLHGLGASPWHFLKVAPLFFQDCSQVEGLNAGSGQSPILPKVAFIFPFAPVAMASGEFGAIENSCYGSFKWWDIFNGPTDLATPKPVNNIHRTASAHIPGYTGTEEWRSPQPSVIHGAIPTPLVNQGPNMNLLHSGSASRIGTPGSKIKHLLSCPLSPEFSPEPGGGAHGICLCGRRSLPEKGHARRSESVDGTASATIGLENPKDREVATNLVIGLINTLKSTYKIPSRQVVVAGFSQGAMLALDVFLTMKDQPALTGVFSGAPMCVHRWKQLVSSNRNKMSQVPVLMAHGTSDWVIPIWVGRWLRRFLRRQGLAVRMIEFDGEHELPEPVLFEFNKAVYALSQSLGCPPNMTTIEAPGSALEGFSPRSTAQRGRAGHGRILDKVDDVLYKLGYAFASCVLPVAKRIC